MDSEPAIAHGGIVRSVSGGRAVVAVATGGCGGCGRRAGCGIAKLAPGREETLVSVAAAGLTLAPGMEVIVEVPAASLLRAAVAGYLLPALLLLAGAVAGHAAAGDAGAAGGALAGLAAGLSVSRRLGARNPLRLRAGTPPAPREPESR
ncbi:MAG TPA: SoxR reducing system RseC family protein [Burkholderiales bacterium]|nr:SoxR reducing system RseC family protein [Burkholderiales bacterium]